MVQGAHFPHREEKHMNQLDKGELAQCATAKGMWRHFSHLEESQ